MSIWKTFADLTYALLYHSSRLRRLLRAPLIQKERFFYVCIRIKALSLIFLLQIYAFIRLYTIIYVCKRLFESSQDFQYTFIYDYIRLQTLVWKLLRFQIYVYIRLYTFKNACLEIFEISNIRSYTIIYVLKRRNSIFKIFKYTNIYVYIRFKS